MTSTWHHGLVADWWAIYNTDGPEIEYFGRLVEAGQPALDAGCGTGRLLVPWLKAGWDVDGCDVSADMRDRCRERAAAEGVEPRLWVSSLRELVPERRYRTIVVCGVFGIATTREQDMEALRRLFDALEPCGTLLLDIGTPYVVREEMWQYWTPEGGSGSRKISRPSRTAGQHLTAASERYARGQSPWIRWTAELTWRCSRSGGWTANWTLARCIDSAPASTSFTSCTPFSVGPALTLKTCMATTAQSRQQPSLLHWCT
jgi:SAM-dependent methyltransferase